MRQACGVVCLTVLLLLGIAIAQEIEFTTLGVPISNVELATGQQKCYFVRTAILPNLQDNEAVTFSVTPLSGDADLYVSPNLCPTNNCTDCWKSDGPNGDIVSVFRGDSKWPLGATARFYIAVKARTPTAFSLNVYTRLTHLVMTNGIPQSAVIPVEGDHNYFKFNLDTHHNFSVVATPVNGDPDIFASVRYQYPNFTHHDSPWGSRDWGFDYIHITDSNPSYTSNGTYFVGIHAWRVTYFTLAITKDGEYTLLVEAIPLGHVVNKGEYKFFRFRLMATTAQLIFTVNALDSGDPDLYLNYNVTDVTEPKPTKENHQKSKIDPGSDIFVWNNAQPGWYYLGIYGYTRTKFEVTATSEEKTVLLNDGTPQASYVNAGAWTFFKYFHGDTHSDFTVNFDVIGSGNINVYHSTQGTYKDPAKFDGQLFKLGSNSVYFGRNLAKTGNYYFGVYGVVTSNFTVLAASNQSIAVLREGEPSWHTVPKGYYRYFFYEIRDIDQDIAITANPFFGEVNMYASTSRRYPSATNHTWNSERYGQDTIVIPAKDPGLRGRTRLYVAIYGVQRSSFKIMAYLSSTTIELKDGIQEKGIIAHDKYFYYKFYNLREGSVTINLHATGNGNPDIYASTVNPKPTFEDHEKAGSNFGDDIITFDSAPRGWVYIGVYGASEETAAYRIVARVDFNFLDVNNVAMLHFTRAGSVTQFQTRLWGYCDYIIPAVTLISGRTSLLVSSNASMPVTWENAMWRDTRWPGNVLLISKNDKGFKSWGTYRIAVNATQDSDYFVSAVCTTHENWWYTASLKEGIPRLGIAPAGEPVNYEFDIAYNETGHPPHGYLIEIRVMKGHLGAYASQSWDIIPSFRNYTWKSSGFGARTLFLRRQEITAGRGVYISLYGEAGHPATYEITVATIGTPKFLMQEQPNNQIVAPNSLGLFRAFNARGAKEIHIHVEACGPTRAAPQIFAAFDNKVPDATKHSYKSTEVDRYRQLLHAQFKPTDVSGEPKVLYIGAPNTDPKESMYFSVFVTNKDDSRPRVTTRILRGGQRKGQLLIRFLPAIAPPGFDAREFVYTLWFKEIEMDGDNPKQIPNFVTVCGVEATGKAAGPVTTIDRIDGHYEYLIDLDPSKVFRLNVIVSDGLGLSAAYEPVFYVNGAIYTDWPGILGFRVSIGFIIILIGTLLFVTYIVVGSIIQCIRGKRGLQVIPNLSFWQDLPSLVKDGILFVLTCGRKADSYDAFHDESSVNAESTPSETTKEEPKPAQTTSAGGYGAI